MQANEEAQKQGGPREPPEVPPAPAPRPRSDPNNRRRVIRRQEEAVIVPQQFGDRRRAIAGLSCHAASPHDVLVPPQGGARPSPSTFRASQRGSHGGRDPSGAGALPVRPCTVFRDNRPATTWEPLGD